MKVSTSWLTPDPPAGGQLLNGEISAPLTPVFAGSMIPGGKEAVTLDGYPAWFQLSLGGFRMHVRDRRGFALEATLILLVLMASLAAAAVMGAAMVQRNAGVDYRGTRVNYAAEAGADNVMAQLETAMLDGLITDPELAALTPPTLAGFTITTRANRTGAAVPRTIANGSYAGLIGLNQQIDITVSAVDATRNRSDAIVSVNAQSIPLFQFGVFYEKDLEIHNGPPMTFAGWVHTNGNLYLSSDNTFFQDVITTPGNVYWQRKAYNERRNGVWINNAAGTPVRLTFDSRSEPTAAGFSAASNRDFDGRLMTGAMGVTPLRLPLPTGMPPIELILPRNGGDLPSVRSVKMAWKADYHIVVDLNLLPTPCAPGAMTVLPARVTPDVPSGDCDAIFKGFRNRFVDGREDVGVDLLEIDVGRLMNWIDVAPANRATSIMYVTFINGSVADLNRDYPAVRIRNGRTLTHPFTLATSAPLYVWGNFNDIGWRPASLLSDAITFLSNQWTDAAHAAYAVTNATTEMWVYAAVAAGHSATPCDWQDAACNPALSTPPALTANGSYGGGLENFPRFLENWGTLMHYRGSLVSLFEAGQAKLHRWSWRGYYSPPQRDWQFETRFRDPSNLPPGTPMAGSVTQIAFRPVY